MTREKNQKMELRSGNIKVMHSIDAFFRHSTNLNEASQ